MPPAEHDANPAGPSGAIVLSLKILGFKLAEELF
jgi:hypothetical protein